jgi:hypothetical protein
VWQKTDLRFVCLITVGVIETFIGMVTNNRLFISIDIVVLHSGWGKALDCERSAQEGHKLTVCTQAIRRCGM